MKSHIIEKKKALRTFDVTVPEITYHTVTVQAETQKLAKIKAVEMLEGDYYDTGDVQFIASKARACEVGE